MLAFIYSSGPLKKQRGYSAATWKRWKAIFWTFPSVMRACDGCGTVIHSAGFYRFGFPYRRRLYEVNYTGTRHMLHAARQAGVSRFVHVSSAGALKNGGDDFPSAPSFGCHYMKSKWRAEQAVLDSIRQGFPGVIASPTCPIGAGDETPTPTGKIIVDFLRGGFPVASRTGINFISVRDLANGILRVTNRGRIGERYVLGHHNILLPEFLSLLARETELAPALFCLPWPLVLAAGITAEIASIPYGSWPFPLTLETALHARHAQHFSVEKARQHLDWEPFIPLRHSVWEAIEWFYALHPKLATRCGGMRFAVRERSDGEALCSGGYVGD